MFDLVDIKDLITKYANITAEIAKVHVEVVNADLKRVAGTGFFEDFVGDDISNWGEVYKYVLRTGKRQIITNPRENDLCKKCPNKKQCHETLEISTPIKVHDEILGVIGMVCTNEESKKNVLSNLNSYLEYLDQIADFISAKVIEMMEEENEKAIVNMLELIMKNMNQGAVIIDNQGNIDMINPSAKKQLGINRIIGNEKIQLNETGDTVNNYKEYSLVIKGKKYLVYGDIYDIRNNQRYSKMLLFRGNKQISSDIYSMTSTVHAGGTELILGDSKEVKRLKAGINKIANSKSTVLITGESGTGKEMVATAIWKSSNRSEERFVAINCASIPEALLESELFGYVKGAFTGADPNGRIGKFELANKGIIFLDEIGDMPLYLQTKILRVIQERTITRIGSNRVIPLDIRIIAATNKDLRQMIDEKKFREDLYYRLNVIPITIPPLRERRQDIEILVTEFALRYSRLMEKTIIKIMPETMERLKRYNWYGNVRELENVVEFMVNMMEDGILDDETLPKSFDKEMKKDYVDEGMVTNLKVLEMNEIERAMKFYPNTTEGKSMMAKDLGIGIATLYRKIHEYGLN
ncbi:MAG: sigma 54-interacting transcriptional regulator [Tissierellia bacterium]|nr:sigma 54-interacting transcriptional regulator [Tissierellia bacterium]